MKLFFQRGLNLLRIIISYLLSRLIKRSLHWGYPVAVSIEPNNTCNLHCPECPSGTMTLSRQRGIMHPELFRSTIDQLMPHLSWLTLYFQGEPYLNRHLFDFITYAKSKGIYVFTSTNGHYLDEAMVIKTLDSGLDRLIISLDGPEQESYAIYRKGGDFERVISGIRLLVNEKRRKKLRYPKIILQCLLLRSNEKRVDEMRRLARELGVDKLEFKTAQFNNFEKGNPLMPENPKFSRYVKTAHHHITSSAHQLISTSAHQHISTSAHYHIKNPFNNSCFRMWSSCVITWDGKVVPCCFDKDADHVLGDLTMTPFLKIWKGNPYDEYRKTILSNRKSIDICRNCSQTF